MANDRKDEKRVGETLEPDRNEHRPHVDADAPTERKRGGFATKIRSAALNRLRDLLR